MRVFVLPVETFFCFYASTSLLNVSPLLREIRHWVELLGVLCSTRYTIWVFFVFGFLFQEFCLRFPVATTMYSSKKPQTTQDYFWMGLLCYDFSISPGTFFFKCAVFGFPSRLHLKPLNITRYSGTIPFVITHTFWNLRCSTALYIEGVLTNIYLRVPAKIRYYTRPLFGQNKVHAPCCWPG